MNTNKVVYLGLFFLFSCYFQENAFASASVTRACVLVWDGKNPIGGKTVEMELLDAMGNVLATANVITESEWVLNGVYVNGYFDFPWNERGYGVKYTFSGQSVTMPIDSHAIKCKTSAAFTTN